MCPVSFHSLIPWIMVIQSGGNYSFNDDGNSVTLGCPDHTRQVVHKVTRETVDD
ncbi:MAG: hypothetical protein ACFFCR_12780 [Promethearchaeota archaeon]